MGVEGSQRGAARLGSRFEAIARRPPSILDSLRSLPLDTSTPHHLGSCLPKQLLLRPGQLCPIVIGPEQSSHIVSPAILGQCPLTLPSSFGPASTRCAKQLSLADLQIWNCCKIRATNAPKVPAAIGTSTDQAKRRPARCAGDLGGHPRPDVLARLVRRCSSSSSNCACLTVSHLSTLVGQKKGQLQRWAACGAGICNGTALLGNVLMSLFSTHHGHLPVSAG